MLDSVHLLYCLSWCGSVASLFPTSSNSFSASVSLCVIPCSHKCLLYPRSLPMFAYVVARTQQQVSPSCFAGRVSSWTQSSPFSLGDWLTWSVSARVLLSLLHARTGLTKVHTMPDFLRGAHDMDSALPICTASPLPTELSPQLLWFFFFCKAVFFLDKLMLIFCLVPHVSIYWDLFQFDSFTLRISCSFSILSNTNWINTTKRAPSEPLMEVGWSRWPFPKAQSGFRGDFLDEYPEDENNFQHILVTIMILKAMLESRY